MTSRPIEIRSGHLGDLAESAIDPDWIIDGSPRARSVCWSSGTDGVDTNYVWDCTAGRFRWYFDCDETIHVIEGEVEVSGDGVDPIWLRAGDAALFRGGTWATWNVPHYVRKHAILHSELPGPLRAQIFYGRRAKAFVRRVVARRKPVDMVGSAPRL